MYMSLSTNTWALIAAGATAVNLVAMRWIITVPRYRDRMALMPLIGLAFVAVRVLAERHAVAERLYVYAAFMLVFPIATGPVRGRIARDHDRWARTGSMQVDFRAFAWMIWSVMAMIVAIVYLPRLA